MAELIRLGALAPLTRPGWVEAGRHLLAGIDLAMRDINDAGGVCGRRLAVQVADTAADPARAATAVRAFAAQDVDAVVGEYHSVAAMAAARAAHESGLMFVSSSAVIDTLADQPLPTVARLAPMQSRGWALYAEFLLALGHRRVSAAVSTSPYWSAGASIMERHLRQHGAQFDTVTIDSPALAQAVESITECDSTALLLLCGFADPAKAVVSAVRADRRKDGLLLGAPAGQAEFDEWIVALEPHGTRMPFLQYLPDSLTPLGQRVRDQLTAQLGRAPSFVALEGYDAVLVVADQLSDGRRRRPFEPIEWGRSTTHGTRGLISLRQDPRAGAWTWPDAPIQVAQRDDAGGKTNRVVYRSA